MDFRLFPGTRDKNTFREEKKKAQLQCSERMRGCKSTEVPGGDAGLGPPGAGTRRRRCATGASGP